jgi:hypothetical protein
VDVGDVVRADDDETGFGGEKEGRPYLVVSVVGNPPHLLYLVPRSATGMEGVPTPADVLPGLNKAGNFLLDPLPVPLKDLGTPQVVGRLPEPYLSRVLERIHRGLMELDE